MSGKVRGEGTRGEKGEEQGKWREGRNYENIWLRSCLELSRTFSGVYEKRVIRHLQRSPTETLNSSTGRRSWGFTRPCARCIAYVYFQVFLELLRNMFVVLLAFTCKCFRSVSILASCVCSYFDLFIVLALVMHSHWFAVKLYKKRPLMSVRIGRLTQGDELD